MYIHISRALYYILILYKQRQHRWIFLYTHCSLAHTCCRRFPQWKQFFFIFIFFFTFYAFRFYYYYTRRRFFSFLSLGIVVLFFFRPFKPSTPLQPNPSSSYTTASPAALLALVSIEFFLIPI